MNAALNYCKISVSGAFVKVINVIACLLTHIRMLIMRSWPVLVTTDEPGANRGVVS